MNNTTLDMLRSSHLSEALQALKAIWMPVRLSAPAEIQSAIGQCIVSFQSLEYAMKTFIQVLLDLDQTQTKIMTSELSFRSLTCTFRALVLQKNISESALLCSVIKSIEDAGTIRNGLVHGNWIAQTTIKNSIKSKR